MEDEYESYVDAVHAIRVKELLALHKHLDHDDLRVIDKYLVWPYKVFMDHEVEAIPHGFARSGSKGITLAKEVMGVLKLAAEVSGFPLRILMKRSRILVSDCSRCWCVDQAGRMCPFHRAIGEWDCGRHARRVTASEYLHAMQKQQCICNK